MVYYLTCIITYIFLSLFCKWEIRGRHNVPKKGAFIIASNHSSYLDPPILAIGCFPKFLNFMGKEELFEGGFWRWYCLNTGCIPLRRKSGDFRAMKICIRKIKDGQPLALFPEGERSLDGNIGQAQPGIGF